MTEERRGVIQPEKASAGLPPSHGAGLRGANAADEKPTVELVVRLQPFGPTVSIHVSRDARLRDVKAQALAKMGKTAADAAGYVMTLEGRHPLPEDRTVRDERLFDLAFIQLGRPAEVGLTDSNEGT